MKLRAILLVVAISALGAIVFFVYHSSPVRAQPQSIPPNATPCCGEARVAPRELDFPYYSLADGYRSKLLLVSDSPKSIDLTITIRNLYGQTLLTSETIQP